MENTVIPKNKKHLKSLIRKEILLNGNKCNLNHINTSRITNMFHLFYKSQFNGDISGWDVSKVKDMTSMFSNSQFNGDLSM